LKRFTKWRTVNEDSKAKALILGNKVYSVLIRINREACAEFIRILKDKTTKERLQIRFLMILAHTAKGSMLYAMNKWKDYCEKEYYHGLTFRIMKFAKYEAKLSNIAL